MSGKSSTAPRIQQHAEQDEHEADAARHQAGPDEDPGKFPDHHLAHADGRGQHGLEDIFKSHAHVKAVAALEKTR